MVSRSIFIRLWQLYLFLKILLNRIVGRSAAEKPSDNRIDDAGWNELFKGRKQIVWFHFIHPSMHRTNHPTAVNKTTTAPTQPTQTEVEEQTKQTKQPLLPQTFFQYGKKLLTGSHRLFQGRLSPPAPTIVLRKTTAVRPKKTQASLQQHQMINEQIEKKKSDTKKVQQEKTPSKPVREIVPVRAQPLKTSVAQKQKTIRSVGDRLLKNHTEEIPDVPVHASHNAPHNQWAALSGSNGQYDMPFFSSPPIHTSRRDTSNLGIWSQSPAASLVSPFFDPLDTRSHTINREGAFEPQEFHDADTQFSDPIGVEHDETGNRWPQLPQSHNLNSYTQSMEVIQEHLEHGKKLDREQREGRWNE
ncbi:MAG: hypothetical protein JW795_18180 [Chitinivibrionales bacterium]|nr:hypothetical protein [Chitinivibrionales bacterium]